MCIVKCETSDLEIETIYSRIVNGDINLQPDFQRGEVWSIQKKKKLIDSILRQWKIPPIHVVRSKSAIDEVLDGQQRLVTIRDFLENKLSIDGNLAPIDSNMQKLDGKFYKDLEVQVQRTFRQYSIIVVRLTEYKAEEPAELFYRLNQPTSLTSAEQRNAFIGQTRNQIKDLVALFVELGASKENIGFSNSRLAYDEVISKLCFAIESATLKKKITSTEISERYRNDIAFSEKSVFEAKNSIEKFMKSLQLVKSEIKLSFNKATLFSWLIFTKSNESVENEKLAKIISLFETYRQYQKGKIKNNLLLYESDYSNLQNKYPFFEIMLNTFNQRASMGSTDALSIIYRDIILNVFYDMQYDKYNKLLEMTRTLFSDKQNMSLVLESIASNFDWGGRF